MAFWEAVVFIVAIGAVVSIVRARYGVNETGERVRPDPDAARTQAEIVQLKERIAVLERVITDEHAPRRLDAEIEKLR